MNTEKGVDGATESPVFAQHMEERHGSEKQVLDLLRQTTEAVHIREDKPALNCKDEHNTNRPRRRREALEN